MMFLEPGSKHSPFRKFLPWGLLVAAAIAGGFVFFGSRTEVPEQDLQVVRAGDPEFERYKAFLALRDVKIQMGLNFARKRILMLSGVLLNKGDRPVDVLEVKVVFLNYETQIHESLHLPVKPSPYTPPVEPLSERAFNFYIEEFPQGWLNSHAEMHLNGFRIASR